MDKQITPEDPRQVDVERDKEPTTAMAAGRKTMHGSWARKTMYGHGWMRKTMVHWV